LSAPCSQALLYDELVRCVSERRLHSQLAQWLREYAFPRSLAVDESFGSWLAALLLSPLAAPHVCCLLRTPLRPLIVLSAVCLLNRGICVVTHDCGLFACNSMLKQQLEDDYLVDIKEGKLAKTSVSGTASW
jgi:hypothetical protein